LATGVMYGVATALFKTCSADLAHPLTLLTKWPVYVLMLAGAVGMVLNQSLYQIGVLAPGLTSLTLAEPVTAVAIGITAFHERLALDPVSSAALIGAVLAIAGGLWLITTDGSAAFEGPLDAVGPVS
jgi:hypothetical protein